MATQRASIESNDMVTVPRAARIIGVHFTTLYRWIGAGTILSWKLGGIVFIPRSEVERLRKESEDKEEEAA